MRLAVLLGIAAVAGVLLILREDPQAKVDHARSLLKRNPTAAERLLEEIVVASGGDRPEAQILRCRALGAMHRWTEAAGCFHLIDKPSECPPEDLLALADEAQAAGALNLTDRALQAATESSSHRAAALRRLIALDLQLGRADAALEHCRELAALSPDDPFPWRVAAEIHRQRLEIEKALPAVDEALARNPSPAEEHDLRNLRLELLISDGQVEAARRELDRLLAQSAPTPVLAVKRAYVLRLEGRSDEALRVLNELLAEHPDTVSARQTRGLLRLDRRDYAGAAADFERVLQDQPHNKEVHYKLAQAYRELGRPEEAQAHLAESERLTRLSLEILDTESCLARDPENESLRRQLAELQQEVRRTDSPR